MSGQHRNPAKAFRPDPAEHDAAVAALPPGWTMDGYLCACQRLLAERPDEAAELLAPYLQQRRRGRPPKDD